MKKRNLTGSLLLDLKCPGCGKTYNHSELQTFATCCEQPLYAHYDLSKAPSRDVLKNRKQNMWRYKELLPVIDGDNIISLNEGFTPIIQLDKNVWIKDEGVNPTGSFKARGQSAAISKAVELGVQNCIIPTAGNAGGAMSAYCAKANIRATVVMPAITPKIFLDECQFFGAEVIQINGLINDCGRKVSAIKQSSEAFDVSTMKEPYRMEGKKTMGYEIAEQFNWELPDVIIYPAGGGTGLIGIWKAFKEMREMGWLQGPLPRMIAVQSENCQPLVKAYDDLHGITNDYQKAKPSIAYGLAVPHSFGHDLMMRVLAESGGMAVSVKEKEIIFGMKEIAENKGFLLCPEGVATYLAMIHLKNSGALSPEEKILLINTGSAYKYMESVSKKLKDWEIERLQNELSLASMYDANE